MRDEHYKRLCSWLALAAMSTGCASLTTTTAELEADAARLEPLERLAVAPARSHPAARAATAVDSSAPQRATAATPAPRPTAPPVSESAGAEPPAAVAAAIAAPPAPPRALAPYWIQVGAYSDERRLGNARARFRRDFPDPIGDLDFRTERFAPPGRDKVYLRLLAGGFDDRATAMRTCDTLKASGADCLVRRLTNE